MKGGDVSYVQKENEQETFSAKFSQGRAYSSKKYDEYGNARRISYVMVDKSMVLFHWPARRRRPFFMGKK